MTARSRNPRPSGRGGSQQFLPALKEHAPDDFQTILDWFPLADLELIRRGL